MSDDEDELDEPEIEEGDLVIGIAEDGRPYVAWAGEPAPELADLAEQDDGEGESERE